MSKRLPVDDRALFRLAVLLVAAITLIRIIVLLVTPLQLYPDEAQYWWWAQNVDWGYFSKPPLIAWIIWLTTRVSDAEWAIRLASPLLHAGTALLLFRIGRLSYDVRVGFWSALAYATLPGISYSSGLISTDVPLLFCWAVALYTFLRARADLGWGWPVLCGVALGFGLLAKYAMFYFVLGAVVAALVEPRARRLVFSTRGCLILALGLLILSPNLIWNAAHGWPTLAHTEANANWSHARYSITNASEFIVGQLGVFGPLMMTGWIAALWRLRPAEHRDSRGRILAAFSAPVLILVTMQSFISEANANWAAPAYIAAVPLAVDTLLRWWHARALWLSLALGTAAMLALWIATVDPALAERVGEGNALKRQEGWRELGEAVVSESHRTSYDAIAAANRSVLAELLYYARPRGVPIRAWDASAIPRDHFQMTMPLTPAFRHVLLVLYPDDAPRVIASFDSHSPVKQLSIPLGRRRTRVLSIYDAEGFHVPQHPHQPGLK
ncbi:MAG TPA: glycosyltransferase family 39 protein [Rhizomicrobium sp.]